MSAPREQEGAGPDPYAWLEEVASERALAWVRERNALTEAELETRPENAAMRAQIRAILDSREQIPQVARRGAHLYNFWRDEQHPRGLWRRTTLQQFRLAEPEWDVLLDLDALAAAEGENWVWAGATVLGPNYRRAMLALSRGGADARVQREFDLPTRRFVDNGFVLPEAKSTVTWIDADQLYVGSDFGPGSLTDSGYPRTVRRWQRGLPPAQAALVFEGVASDIGAGVSVDHTPGFERTVFYRAIDFYRSRLWLLQGEQLLPVDKPDDAQLSFWREWVLVELRSDWTRGGVTWPRGSLLVAPAATYLAGAREFVALFTPTATRSLAGFDTTRGRVVLNLLDNVASQLEEWQPDADGAWTRRAVAAPSPGTLSASALHDPWLADDELAESLLIGYADFLTPDSLLLGQTGSDALDVLKRRPSYFDAQGMRVEQRFARSKDGTSVPYFVVWPREPRADGRNPTLLYGYGGFEVSMLPSYSGTIGSQWLARGGVYVLANIRGGGEFGPAWHQAALTTQRQKSFDDFAAVAEDLIARGITRAEHLGIEGGSNGGLLVGAVMLQRPELLRAVVCQVPLLDMLRYHRLLAGASWMAEYGDPDVAADREVLAAYSPYQNVRAGTALPVVLFTTSTRDDRVHPAHARKMAARMLEQGHRVLYWENIEGGHGGAADNAQRARMLALELGFLWHELAPASAAA